MMQRMVSKRPTSSKSAGTRRMQKTTQSMYDTGPSIMLAADSTQRLRQWLRSATTLALPWYERSEKHRYVVVIKKKKQDDPSSRHSLADVIDLPRGRRRELMIAIA